MIDPFDIFFSYAPKDNRNPGDGKSPIDRLIKDIKNKVENAYYGEDVTVKCSEDLGAGEPEDEYFSRARICIPIITPRYVSDKILLENLNTISVNYHSAMNPILALFYRRLTDDQEEKIGTLLHLRHHFSPSEDGANRRARQTDPFSLHSKGYIDATAKLAEAISDRLKVIRAAATQPGRSNEVIDSSKFRVLLIYNEREQELKRRGTRIAENLKNRMTKQGEPLVQVLGEGSYEGAENRQGAFERALTACDLFVQLIGEEPGDCPAWAADGVVCHMGALASESKKPVLRGRDPNVALKTLVDRQAKLAKFIDDPAHPGIAQEETVFEQTVMARVEEMIAERVRSSRGVESGRTGTGLIVRDRNTEFVREIEKKMRETRGWRPVRCNLDMGSDEKTPREALHDIYEHSPSIVMMRDMDDEAAPWVNGQYDLYFSYFDADASRVYPKTALCHAPPAKLDVGGTSYPEVKSVDCRDIDPRIPDNIAAAFERLAHELATP